jgi:hypothetical protein
MHQLLERGFEIWPCKLPMMSLEILEEARNPRRMGIYS